MDSIDNLIIIDRDNIVINDANGRTWREYANSNDTQKQITIHPNLGFAYTNTSEYGCNGYSSLYNYLVIYDGANTVNVDSKIVNGQSYILQWQSCMRTNGVFGTCHMGEGAC